MGGARDQEMNQRERERHGDYSIFISFTPLNNEHEDIGAHQRRRNLIRPSVAFAGSRRDFLFLQI